MGIVFPIECSISATVDDDIVVAVIFSSDILIKSNILIKTTLHVLRFRLYRRFIGNSLVGCHVILWTFFCFTVRTYYKSVHEFIFVFGLVFIELKMGE